MNSPLRLRQGHLVITGQRRNTSDVARNVLLHQFLLPSTNLRYNEPVLSPPLPLRIIYCGLWPATRTAVVVVSREPRSLEQTRRNPPAPPPSPSSPAWRKTRPRSIFYRRTLSIRKQTYSGARHSLRQRSASSAGFSSLASAFSGLPSAFLPAHGLYSFLDPGLEEANVQNCSVPRRFLLIVRSTQGSRSLAKSPCR